MSPTEEFAVYSKGRFEWERIFRRIVVPSSLRAVKGVGMMLASFANADGTSVFPGEEGLAGFCQSGKSTVGPALRWMREQYLIHRRSHQVTRGGRRLADEYQLCMPNDWESRFVLLPSNGHDVDLVIPRPARVNNPKPFGSRFKVETDRQTSNQPLVDR
ncbi:hypothetical protein AB0L22_09175 [Micromonospora haikouensis]|uniref:hypothetical protein n=1 Tax=Micromonospora haikouensis TaxID=686309 RepID=UPI00342BAD1F